MAGIGFELVKLLREGSYRSLARVVSLTTLMGSGPGLFILLSIGAVCFVTLFAVPTKDVVEQFLAIVMYLFSFSMILSAMLQYTFFRFIADKVFLKEFDLITPNFIGILLVQLCLSLSVALPIIFYFFSSHSLLFKLVILASFILLNMIWLSTVLLTGFKSYRQIVMAFVVAYSAMTLLHFYFEQHNNLIALLLEFLIAQLLLFALLLRAIIDYYPTNQLCRFDFFKQENWYYSLVFANFFYQLGFWVDKFIFWFNPTTGHTILFPLRISPIYDLPIFIAMMAVIPATSMFMLKLESQFALAYPKMMETIFHRKTLAEIEEVRDEIINTGRETIFSMMKIQLLVVIILLFSSLTLFTFFKINYVYLPLLTILMIATSLQMLLWAFINLFYYMTKYREALCVASLFFTSNSLLTLLSIKAGPWFYGYGLTISVLLCVIVGFLLLNKNFKEILYATFMMTD